MIITEKKTHGLFKHNIWRVNRSDMTDMTPDMILKTKIDLGVEYG